MFNTRFLGCDDTYYPDEVFRTDYEPFEVAQMAILARFPDKKDNKKDDKPTCPYSSIYELTLTTTKDDPYELRQFVRKVAESSIYAVIDMPYCIELTKSGLPHIHACIYSTKKYLDASKIKVLKFPYRYELKRVNNLEKYINYINKEKDSPHIIDYCKLKGIPQFDNGIQKETTVQTPTNNDIRETQEEGRI